MQNPGTLTHFWFIYKIVLAFVAVIRSALTAFKDKSKSFSVGRDLLALYCKKSESLRWGLRLDHLQSAGDVLASVFHVTVCVTCTVIKQELSYLLA